MLGASMEHGLHNARKPASRGGGGSGPARRHNKTQVEIEVMNLKRRLRQRQEELVAKDAAYMAMHPEYPEMVGDFLQAALAAKPKTGQAALGEDHRHDVPVWRPLSSLNGVLAAKSAAHRIHARLHEKAEARKHARDEGDAGGGARDAPEL